MLARTDPPGLRLHRSATPPAGIEHGAVMALTFADEAVVVTNPEVLSVRDSDRIPAFSRPSPGGPSKAGAGQGTPFITRYNPGRVEAGKCFPAKDIQETWVPIIGVVPNRGRAAGFQPGRPGHPPKNPTPPWPTRTSIARFPRRGKPLRFVDYVRPGIPKAPVRASEMSLLFMLFGNKPKPPRSPRSACSPSSSPTSATAAATPTSRPTCSAN